MSDRIPSDVRIVETDILCTLTVQPTGTVSLACIALRCDAAIDAAEQEHQVDSDVRLDALPAEVLVHVATFISGRQALVLAACSSSLRAAALAEASWRTRLESIGFTAAGIALWLSSGRTLRAAFRFCDEAHEALEVALLRAPLPARGAGWDGFCDVRATLELANPWPQSVWTFFVPCTSEEDAPWANGEEVALHPAAYGICCAGYPALDNRSRCGATHLERDAVVLSFAPATQQHDLPRNAQPDHLLSVGWLMLKRITSSAAEDELLPVEDEVWELPEKRAVKAFQAMLLPAHAAGSGLVVIGENVWRLDEPTWRAAAARGSLNVEVLQATDVRLAGHSLPLVDEAPFDLGTTFGAQVPTARVSFQNYKLTGRSFEWADRVSYESRGGKDGGELQVASDLHSWRVVLAAAPPAEEMTALTFTALRRSRATLTLSDWDSI